MTKIKLMTYNVESSMNVTKGYWQYITAVWKYVIPHSQKILTHIIDYINESKIDIVTFTEIDAGSFRTKHLNQLEFISINTGLNEKAFFPLRNFRKILNQGNGVISKYPLKHREYYHLVSGKEARYMFDTIVKINKKDVHIMVTHLTLGKKKRAIELKQIADVIQNMKGPVILSGDFNTGDQKVLSILTDIGLRDVKTVPTFPSWNPKKSYDHIFISKHFKILDVHLSTLKVSDHLGMVCELEMK